MTKAKSNKQIETVTAMSLEIPEHVEPIKARSDLLDKLLELALAGDVRAAKLYLDYSFKSNAEAKSGLALEDAIQLMQTPLTEPTASDDDAE
jgi:hypothetical protein